MTERLTGIAILLILVACTDNTDLAQKRATMFKDNGAKELPSYQFRSAIRLLKNQGYLPLEDDYYYYLVKLDDDKEAADPLNMIKQVWAIDMHYNIASGEDTTKISILEYQLDSNKQNEQSLEYLTSIFGFFF